MKTRYVRWIGPGNGPAFYKDGIYRVLKDGRVKREETANGYSSQPVEERMGDLWAPATEEQYNLYEGEGVFKTELPTQQQEIVMAKTKGHTHYNFRTTCAALIDDEEILSQLTREEPMIMVYSKDKDGKQKMSAYIHQSVFLKAVTVKKKLRDEFFRVNYIYQEDFSRARVRQLISVVKAVRNAPCRKSFGGSVDVRVDVVNV